MCPRKDWFAKKKKALCGIAFSRAGGVSI